MTLTIGQKKALVTALIFGVNEVNGGAMKGLRKLGLVHADHSPWVLSELGYKEALKLISIDHALTKLLNNLPND